MKSAKSALTLSDSESAFNCNYAPGPESKDHIKIEPRYELFINGKFAKPLSKKYFPTYNPASEEKLSEIAHANARDVDAAVSAARVAYAKT